ncbi:MAG: acetyl-CoA carboxylase biotin carboxyl carrier protein [Ktedonobacterales bacterium]
MTRIKALAEALEESDVSELDLSEGGTRILLRKRVEPTTAVAPRSHGSRPARAPRLRSASAVGPATPPDPGIAIVAPLTGVFYISPSPTSAAFVTVGEAVQAGQVACIVEAMKVFNEIKAEVSGVVTAVLAKNGQLVQKGDALIRVKPV